MLLIICGKIEYFDEMAQLTYIIDYKQTELPKNHNTNH